MKKFFRINTFLKIVLKYAFLSHSVTSICFLRRVRDLTYVIESSFAKSNHHVELLILYLKIFGSAWLDWLTGGNYSKQCSQAFHNKKFIQKNSGHLSNEQACN